MNRSRRFARGRSHLGLRKLFLALIPILLSLLYLSGSAGFINHYRLAQRRRQLEEKAQTLEARKAALQQEIDRLKGDPAYQEKVARELYGLCRADEVVFMMKLEEETTERAKK
ncbi:MAG: septum formation initiator family protein [candidate division KSB1 bacterium]|nr:septum formation initiator family protein [candidate division KSB1 bacterium]MDZ7414361.1 septum formation initiator family protein [candidate division KSB1 bacterium]